MDLTAGARTTAVAAATVLAAGITVILYGIARNDLARSLGGACLSITALTLIALVAIRRWVTDTEAERARLAEDSREAQNEKTRAIAAQAALEMERQRLARDAAADRARTAAILRAEREAMRDQFEEQRAKLASDAFATGVRMERSGALEPESEHDRAQVIGLFPQQERERARDAGARSRP